MTGIERWLAHLENATWQQFMPGLYEASHCVVHGVSPTLPPAERGRLLIKAIIADNRSEETLCGLYADAFEELNPYI